MSRTLKLLKRLGVSRKPPAHKARIWSNRSIALLADHAAGDIINVSAWKDEDKEGRRYRQYFRYARSYSTSNYEGWRGEGVASDYELDLQNPPPPELERRFDLVFNHTTLEHIYDIHRAFKTLAVMSRKSLLVVVPFMQHLHGPDDGDFWRPSPYALRRMFKAEGYRVVHESAGPEGGKVRYVVMMGILEAALDADSESMKDVSFGDATTALRKAL